MHTGIFPNHSKSQKGKRNSSNYTGKKSHVYTVKDQEVEGYGVCHNHRYFLSAENRRETVSYTHLTLPTILLV